MTMAQIRVEVDYCPDGQGKVVTDTVFDKTIGFPKIRIYLNDDEPIVIETSFSTVLAVRDPSSKPHDLKKILDQKFTETET